MNTTPKPITIGDVYPDFSDEQLAEAEATFHRYISVMVRIYERVRAEVGAEAVRLLASGELTDERSCSTVPVERSTKPTS